MTSLPAETKLRAMRPAGDHLVPRSLPWLIAALSMIGPFAIDTYLPSFREMEPSLGASALEVQQSLTAYLLPFALMSLWHGSISDALGRRRVILISLAVLAAHLDRLRAGAEHPGALDFSRAARDRFRRGNGGGPRGDSRRL